MIIRGSFVLAMALGLPLAAQVSADYESVRLRANATLDNGAYTNAQKLYEQALELRRQAFGDNSAPYAAALVDLARAYQAGGRRSADAMKLYQQALPIQESVLGASHPDVATTLYYLAMGSPQNGEHAEQTQRLFQRALDIRTKVFGAFDPRVAEILTPLARMTGDESLYQRSLAILDASAPQSPAAATTLELYGRLLRSHDRSSEAEALEGRAKQIRITHVGEIGARHPYDGPAPLRMGAAGMTAPKVQQKVEPEYTDIARADKFQGTVVLTMEVGAEGLAHNIQLKQGVGLGLDEKAAEAVANWTFVPGTRNGVPVPVMATVEVNFRLM
jgi:TonB family protein